MKATKDELNLFYINMFLNGNPRMRKKFLNNEEIAIDYLSYKTNLTNKEIIKLTKWKKQSKNQE